LAKPAGEQQGCCDTIKLYDAKRACHVAIRPADVKDSQTCAVDARENQYTADQYSACCAKVTDLRDQANCHRAAIAMREAESASMGRDFMACLDGHDGDAAAQRRCCYSSVLTKGESHECLAEFETRNNIDSRQEAMACIAMDASWEEKYHCCRGVESLVARSECVTRLGRRPANTMTPADCTNTANFPTWDERKMCCMKLEMRDAQKLCIEGIGAWTDPAAGCTSTDEAQRVVCYGTAGRAPVRRVSTDAGVDTVEVDTTAGRDITLADVAAQTTAQAGEPKRVRLALRVDAGSATRNFTLVQDGTGSEDIVEVDGIDLECTAADCDADNVLELRVEAPVRIAGSMQVGANTMAKFSAGAEIRGDAEVLDGAVLEINGDVTGGGRITTAAAASPWVARAATAASARRRCRPRSTPATACPLTRSC
jgi:hypothetical protein